MDHGVRHAARFNPGVERSFDAAIRSMGRLGWRLLHHARGSTTRDQTFLQLLRSHASVDRGGGLQRHRAQPRGPVPEAERSEECAAAIRPPHTNVVLAHTCYYAPPPNGPYPL